MARTVDEPGDLLSDGPPSLDRQESPTGAVRRRNVELVEKWWLEEANVERACRTLPFTLFLWVVFVGAQLSHRHVEQGFTLNRAMDRLLNDKHSDPDSGSTDATTTTCRRLFHSLDGRELDGVVSEDEAHEEGEVEERRLATLRVSGLAGSTGIDIDNVQHVESPNSILDWVEETPVRVMWLERNWNMSKSYVSHFNKVVGGIRLMQTRLPKVDCPGSDELVGFYGLECYDEMSEGGDPIGEDGHIRPGFTPVSSDGISDGAYVYWLDIGDSLEETKDRLQYLRDHRWLDSSTNAVEVQIALYNGETAMFIFARVIFQLDRTGYLAKKVLISSMSSNVYASFTSLFMDFMLLACVTVLFIGQILSTFSRYRKGNGLCASILRFQVLLNLVTCWIGFGLGTYFGYISIQTQEAVDILLGVPEPPTAVPSAADMYVEEWATRHQELNTVFDRIQLLRWFQEAAEVAVFWYILLLVVKFFEAFSGIPRLAVITKTLQLASWDLVHFLLVFGIIFGSFSVGAFFLFGQKILEWSTPGLALNTSFRALMGDFDFVSMYNVAPVSATVWFWSYMMLIFLVMLNMLLAIIMDTYCEVKDQSKSNADIFTAAMDVVAKVRMKRAGIDHDQILEDVQTSGQEVNEEALVAAGIPAGAAKHMIRRISKAALDHPPDTPQAGGRQLSKGNNKPTEQSSLIPLRNGSKDEVEAMALPGSTVATLRQAASTLPQPQLQDLETRLIALEQALSQHFNAERQVYIVPEQFAGRAIDVAVGDLPCLKK
mmetsp:Transcript_20254/g.46533  ORF Transcript_20254/g.46533 Transcript_20254/m.46533 type:complete len:772 (-) Transcript_20254:87-2402(-)